MAVYHSADESFFKTGIRRGEFFAHTVVELKKKYPDALLLMEGRGFSYGDLEQGSFLQVNVYARDVGEFPDELFLDRTVNWHNQGFGIKGLVGSAGLYEHEPGRVFVTILQSDLLQQIHRGGPLRSYKSRVENRFKHWARITLAAVLNSTARRGGDAVYVPTSNTITSLLKKKVNPQIFEKIYDEPARSANAERCDYKGFEYWKIDLSTASREYAGYYIEAPGFRIDGGANKVICILHDIEENIDSPATETACRKNLDRMLAIEKQHGLKCTYNVLGTIFPRTGPRIMRDGHDVGFHSFNHALKDQQQLPKVRETDQQIKGYRPPQSELTGELGAYNLCYWNFEWLASSAYSLGARQPFIKREIAYIPIDIDDNVLHTNDMNIDQWLAHILEGVRNSAFYAFSLHDCYADQWIVRYDELLDQILKMAECRTCDNIAGQLFMEAAD